MCSIIFFFFYCILRSKNMVFFSSNIKNTKKLFKRQNSISIYN
ncbi:hypothetical protein PUN28_016535 [Cardiocondyla obscurior]|uniref:Uncharacterized protein n=1 Tax=Cardiocondyla obscurior TaxID=286306 RepID=A0AAW2EMK6_9HYME